MRFFKIIYLREILFFVFNCLYSAASMIINMVSDRAIFILWAIICTATYAGLQYHKIGAAILETEEILKILSVPFLFALFIACSYIITIISFIFGLIFSLSKKES